MNIEEARILLNEVRKKESAARSAYNKYKTEEYNTALKKVKAERRKVVKLCKSLGMNVSPSGVEQPEGAPLWIKKKYRTSSVETAPVENSFQKNDSVYEYPEELKYIEFLKYLQLNGIISKETEQTACAFVKNDFKKREETLREYEETLKRLVTIGKMSSEEYQSDLDALKADLFSLRIQ